MTKLSELSWARLWAMVVKEFIQMRRDRLNFGMMLGLPLVQLILFGYAVNSTPKHMPAAVLLADHGPQARSLLYAIKNSDYFDFVREVHTETEGRDALARGEIQLLVNIPGNFTHDLLRGNQPQVLIEVDATDPGTTGIALGALNSMASAVLRNDLRGPLVFLLGAAPPVDIRVHALYNPEGITYYNIVPGLIGLVLTMTVTLMISLAITREREVGTMENLLSMPARPIEVMVGKIIPYIFVGYIQIGLILAAARFIFHVPMVGSLFLLLAVALVFIAANLAIGITISTVAQNQRQAMQMAMLLFLPSMMLSGFVFPFRGMPIWAQAIGEIFPITHFLRIIRGILLKGNGLEDVAHQLWQVALFTCVLLTIGVKRYRRTLD